MSVVLYVCPPYRDVTILKSSAATAFLAPYAPEQCGFLSDTGWCNACRTMVLSRQSLGKQLNPWDASVASRNVKSEAMRIVSLRARGNTSLGSCNCKTSYRSRSCSDSWVGYRLARRQPVWFDRAPHRTQCSPDPRYQGSEAGTMLRVQSAKDAGSPPTSHLESSFMDVPFREIQLSTIISFCSIHDSHTLTNNFYCRRSNSLSILALLASCGMLLLLHTQELSLEQHPACDNENRHRANNRNHAARSRLVARVEDAFLRDSQRCCGTTRWVERFAVEEVADWFLGRFGCGFGDRCWCWLGSFWR